MKSIIPDPLRLLFELHEPPGATANYQMEYIVTHLLDKEGRRASTEDVPQSEFKDGRLLKSKTIAVNDLENGDYRLDRQPARGRFQRGCCVGQHALADLGRPRATFRCTFCRTARLWDGRAWRPICARWKPSHKRTIPPLRIISALALDQNPANTFAGQSLVQLYFNERKYGPIADLYKRVGIAAFKASPVTLAQIALSFRQSGDAEQARGVITAGLGIYPGNATLSALQSRGR